MNQDHYSPKIDRLYKEIEERYENWAEITWGQLRGWIKLTIDSDEMVKVRCGGKSFQIDDGDEIFFSHFLRPGHLSLEDLDLLNKIKEEILEETVSMTGLEIESDKLSQISEKPKLIQCLFSIDICGIGILFSDFDDYAEKALKGAFILGRILNMLERSIEKRAQSPGSEESKVATDRSLKRWRATLRNLEIAIESLENRAKVYLRLEEALEK